MMKDKKEFWILAPVKVMTYEDEDELIVGSYGGTRETTIKEIVKQLEERSAPTNLFSSEAQALAAALELEQK